MALTAQQILDADDRPLVEVHCPEWNTGGDDVVCVRALDAMEEYELDKRLAALGLRKKQTDDGDEKAQCDYLTMVETVAAALVNYHGERLFGPDDVAALARKSPTALMRCHQVVAAERKRMTEEFKAQVKNDDATANGDSGCVSPSTPDTDTPTS